MILYHGSNQLITRIDLSKSKDFKDFGRSFYLTKDYTRTVAMAQRTTAIMGDGSPEVSPFIFNPSRCPADVRIKKFDGKSAEWALFVLRNREKSTLHAYKHDYDIVIGPVADSRVDAILQEYRRSYGNAYANSTNLNKLAKQLKYPGPEYIQYCFCTEKGIKQLILDL
ncbi:DUF3990 domain-containing protein [Hallella absiana]|uniref:DUF3990 domain-containing protein n=1 Tax=Hallella absiana TaxID=2925336 RepID=UPI0021C9B7F4|nr:DUF3990 domain-containing protein [Hallella absiana]